ncbi:unnamed protein product [Macrosiphum euphorbiae]|uniref:Uncharacterized protein n=1 Tax=Macrosiphum euphorbiae TaxID=13131 RepID=A0AAV0XY10_9HEMI|nr:unnamed protein product [Macrosiphum euphorbiae]
MTSKRTKSRRVREELEFLSDVEDNESSNILTDIESDIEDNESSNLLTDAESHILTSVVNTNNSVEHIITEVLKEDNLNIENISSEVCIYCTIS